MNNTMGWGKLLAFFISYLISVGIIQAIAMVALGLSFDAEELIFTEFQFFVLTALSLLITVPLLSLFIKGTPINSIVGLGLSFKGSSSHIFYGTLLGALVMGLGYTVLIALEQIQFEQVNFVLDSMLYSILGYLCVAVAEEVVFRGYLMTSLLTRYSVSKTLIISSAIFTIAHLGNENLSVMGVFDIMLAGVMLGALYIYTKSLWLPISFHFSWNFFQSHFGFNVSGTDTYSLIETSFSQASALNGGEFGFEGSYLSTLVQVLILASLFYFYKKQPPLTVSN